MKLDNCQIVDSFVAFWSFSNCFALTIPHLFNTNMCQVSLQYARCIETHQHLNNKIPFIILYFQAGELYSRDLHRYRTCSWVFAVKSQFKLRIWGSLCAYQRIFRLNCLKFFDVFNWFWFLFFNWSHDLFAEKLIFCQFILLEFHAEIEVIDHIVSVWMQF